jgi:hypothetical protein
LLLCSLADIEKTELVKAMDAIVRRKGSRKKATQPEPVVKELSQVAVAALQEKSGSPIAVLGYTAAVPFGHILLTSGGTVIVWLMS